MLFSPEEILTKVVSLPSESVYVKSILLSFLIFLSFYLGCLCVALVHFIRFQRKSIDGSFGSNDGSGNMSASHPIAASTPEGSNYGAIGISDKSPFREVFPGSPENRIQRALQPLINWESGQGIHCMRLCFIYEMNWLDDLEGSFQLLTFSSPTVLFLQSA